MCTNYVAMVRQIVVMVATNVAGVIIRAVQFICFKGMRNRAKSTDFRDSLVRKCFVVIIHPILYTSCRRPACYFMFSIVVICI